MKLEYYNQASPNDKDLKQWWDEEYERVALKEYENLARFPGDLVPEYTPYWFWQKVYPLIWKLRTTIWYSKVIHIMWYGYKIHKTDWVRKISPRGYSIRSEIPTRTPIRLQKIIRFVAKHIVRWYGIGHFLEAIAIGDRWGWDCPHCGLSQSEDLFFNPWFRFTNGGSRFTGDYTQHWFEGFFDCPRCLRRWEYEDSD